MSHSMKGLTRRHFLRFTAGMGMAVGIDSLVPAAAKQVGSINDAKNRGEDSDIIDLHVQQNSLKIGRRNAHAFTVNGSFPGPLIRLREGQTAAIRVTNHLQEDTSIHWHGLILPARTDGVPGVSFAGIKAGKTFTYRFPVQQSGTYWYHSHSGMQEQQGFVGPLIIDPIEPEPFQYQRDYAIVLSDWTFEHPHQVLANLKKMSAYYNHQRRTVGTFFQDLPWKQMRMDPTDIADITGTTYTYLMNGMVPESNWTGLFRPGEKVRLRFINASAMTFFDVQIPGLKMTVVQADGQNVQPVTVDEFRISVAETYDVIVEPQENAAYTIFAETMDRSGYARGTLAPQQGMTAPIPKRRIRPLRSMADMGMNHDSHGSHGGHSQQNRGVPQSMADRGMNHDSHGSHGGHSQQNRGVPHGPDTHGPGNAAVPMMTQSRLHEPGIGLESTETHRVLVYSDLRSLKPGLDQRQPEREIELHLTGNMERYMWSFDGKKYSEAKEPIRFYNGERLRLTFVNDTMMEHPIHLHGMWMELENGSGAYKPRKHTITVKPAERLSVEVTADAPGDWAFHCHLLYHMEVGMFRIVSVVDRAAEASH